ncbi:MAG: hypothetical protein ACI3XO_09410 [Eubacteriales bacterium]
MKHTKLFPKLIAAAEALILLAACLAGCGGKTDDPTPPQDNEKEYFTENGQVVRSAFFNNAVQINDFLYYTERYTYTEDTSGGGKLKRQAERVVRLSLKTGNVSSACVDPVCTHMHGSDCPLNIDYLYDSKKMLNLKAIGEWLFYIISEDHTAYDPMTQKDESAGDILTYMVYNTVTGETRELFPHNSVGESGVAPAIFNGTVFGNQIYVTVPEYVKDENGTESLVYSLRSHDVEKNTSNVLYTSSVSFGIPAVTNKRVYLLSSDGDVTKKFSIDHSGKDMREEQEIYTATVAYGTREYYTGGENLNEVCVYNIEAHESKALGIYESLGGFCVANDALYYSTISNADEYMSLDIGKLYEKYSSLTPTEMTTAVTRDINSVQYGEKAQLYSAGLDGEAPKLLFEYEHMVIKCVAAAGNYLYAYITSAQPPEYTVTTTANNGFSRIDLTTGEIMPVPLLGTE